MKVVLTKRARSDLHRLSFNVAKRIFKKLVWWAEQSNPLSFAKRLTNSPLGTYRFRVGSYRIFCDVAEGEIRILLVLTIRKRDHAYDGL